MKSEGIKKWSRFFTILGFAALLAAVVAFGFAMGSRAKAQRQPVVIISDQPAAQDDAVEKLLEKKPS